MGNDTIKTSTTLNKLEDIETIYNLYIDNEKKLPIRVQKVYWTSNFYFNVERVEKVYNSSCLEIIAYGKRYKGDLYHDEFNVSADAREFSLYHEIDSDTFKLEDFVIADDDDISF